MILPDSHQVPRVWCYLGYSSISTPRMSPTGLSPSVVGRSRPFSYARGGNGSPTRDPEEPRDLPAATHVGLAPLEFRLLPVRSPLLGQSRLISVPAGTEMFHFTACASRPYGLGAGSPPMKAGGLPHWEISGSTPACGSPELIAACHVLHRRPKPRHPPSALRSLTTRNFSARQCSCQRAGLTVPCRRASGPTVQGG